MPVFILFGWLAGLTVGMVVASWLVLAARVPLPAMLGPVGAAIAPLVRAVSMGVGISLGALLIVLGFLVSYVLASRAIAAVLPSVLGGPVPTPPLAAGVFPTGGAPVAVPRTPGEFFARGAIVGQSAAINAVALLAWWPHSGLLAGLAFVIISLAAVLFVARSRVYHGFLGWSSWLFPLSYVATGVGLLLFVINLPFAFFQFGLTAISIDWTTGVIETRGGITEISRFNGGFSLGNFTFLVGTAAVGAGMAPLRFTTPSISSHETGHSLNTAAGGGVVLWINAIDQNVLPRQLNLAYGELLAEGHARVMPGTTRIAFSIQWWTP